MRATRARPRPVLPAVASTTVPPGLQAAVALGRLDHGAADAVLDRAAGILGFELEEQRQGPVSMRVTSTSGVLPISFRALVATAN
jgi:hypothetical protein